MSDLTLIRAVGLFLSCSFLSYVVAGDYHPAIRLTAAIVWVGAAMFVGLKVGRDEW